MLYILVGDDGYSLNESLEEIKRGVGDRSLLEANVIALDGRQINLEELRAVCQTPPFLAERRLVVIRGLLERFEPMSKASRRKKAASTASQQNEYEPLIELIAEIPDSTVMVLVDNRVTNRNPLLRGLSGRATVKHFPLLRGARLRQWIQRYVREQDGKMSPQAVDLLARLIGSNLWVMTTEIDKLILFTSGRRIEAGDVEGLVSYVQQGSVFAMVDAILEFKSGAAEQLLRQLLQAGASPAYLLVMLSRQVRMIVRVKELKKQGRPEIEIQNRLGLNSEFVLRKTIEQAERYPLEQIKRLYHKILETDLSIKTGRFGGELALNILIAELSQRSYA